MAVLVGLLILGVHGSWWREQADERELSDPPAERLVSVSGSHATDEASDIEEAARMAIADRLWGCRRRAEAAAARGDYGDALAATDLAKSLNLDEEQRTGIELLARSIHDGLTRDVRDAVESVRRGAVLAAADKLRPLVESGRQEVQRAVDEELEAAGWPSARGSIELPDRITEPPRLGRGTYVRTRRDGAIIEGRVVSEHANGVTLRLAIQGRVLYPTVSAFELEPVDPSAGEGLDLAIRAVLAQDRLHAVLWWGFAAARGGVDEHRLALVRSYLN
jgi:hypothetical protein